METQSLNELQSLLLTTFLARDQKGRRLRPLPMMIFVSLASTARAGAYPGTDVLSARFKVTTAAVRKAEDALESAGLLEFRTTGGDRRVMSYTVLTPLADTRIPAPSEA